MAEEERTVSVRLEMNINQFNAAGGQAAVTVKTLEAEVTKAGASTTALTTGMTSASAATASWGTQMTALGGALTRTITPLALLTEVLIKDYQSGTNALRAGTGETGAALDGLTQSMTNVGDQVPQSLGKIGTAMATLKDRTGSTGADLEKLTKQFMDLDRMGNKATVETVTRVFGDWSVATKDQTAALDRLFRVSQISGTSIQRISDVLVRYGAPLREAGFSFDQAALMMGKFQKEGVNLELVLSGMRIGLGRFASAGKEPKVALEEAIDKIRTTNSETEALSLSFAAFGKRAGVDMARAIREGRFSLKEMQDQLAANHDTVNAAAQDTLHFSDQLGILKNKVASIVGPFGDAGAMIAALALAAGPAAMALGGLQSRLTAMNTSMGAMALKGAEIGVIIAALSVSWSMWDKSMKDADASMKSVIDRSQSKALTESMEQITGRIARLREEVKGLKAETADAGGELKMGSVDNYINTFNALKSGNLRALNPFDVDYRVSLTKATEEANKHAESLERMKYIAAQLADRTGININAALAWVQAQMKLGKTFDSSQDAVLAYMKAQQDNKKTTAEAAEETEKMTSALASMQKEMIGTTRAEEALGKAHERVADARAAAIKSVEKISDAQEAEGKARVKVTDAIAARVDALKKEREAQEGVTAAQAALNKVLAGPSEDIKLSQRDAALKVEQAQKALQDAQVAALKARETGSGADVTKADLGVKAAQLQLDKDIEAQRKTGGLQADAVGKAEKALEAARTQAETAAKAAQKTTEGITQAKRDEQKAHEAVNDAQVASVKAYRAVGDAETAARDALFTLIEKRDAETISLGKNNDKLGELSDHIRKQIKLYPELATAMQPYLDKLDRLRAPGLIGGFAVDALNGTLSLADRYKLGVGGLSGTGPSATGATPTGLGGLVGSRPQVTPAGLVASNMSTRSTQVTFNQDFSGLPTDQAIAYAQMRQEALLTAL